MGTTTTEKEVCLHWILPLHKNRSAFHRHRFEYRICSNTTMKTKIAESDDRVQIDACWHYLTSTIGMSMPLDIQHSKKKKKKRKWCIEYIMSHLDDEGGPADPEYEDEDDLSDAKEAPEDDLSVASAPDVAPVDLYASEASDEESENQENVHVHREGLIKRMKSRFRSEPRVASSDDTVTMPKKVKLKLKDIRGMGLKRRIAAACISVTILALVLRSLPFDMFFFVLAVVNCGVAYFFIKRKKFMRSAMSRSMGRRKREMAAWLRQYTPHKQQKNDHKHAEEPEEEL